MLPNGLCQPPLMRARLLTGNAPMCHRMKMRPSQHDISSLLCGSPVLTGKHKQEAILDVGV
jgi:hypothetical protein